MFVTCGRSDSVCTTPATADSINGLFAVSVRPWISTLSVAGCLNPADSRIRCAFVAFPDAVCESAIWTCPTAFPSISATTANSSQPKNAFFQLSALHRPARAARFRDPMAPDPLPAIPQIASLAKDKAYNTERDEVKFRHWRSCLQVRNEPRARAPGDLSRPERPAP